MSPLRARMIEDMKLAGLAATTQEIYLQAVRSLAKHYNRSPELLAEEEVRRYLLDVRERNARGSFKTSHYGIQFFYRNTLARTGRCLKKDPASQAEAAAADAFPCRSAAHSRRGPQSDTPRLFQPDYGCGLRISEAAALPVTAIDKDQWRPARRRQGATRNGSCPCPRRCTKACGGCGRPRTPRSALALPQWLANRSRRHPCPDPHLCRGRQGGQSPRRSPRHATHAAALLCDQALREQGRHPRRPGVSRSRDILPTNT